MSFNFPVIVYCSEYLLGNLDSEKFHIVSERKYEEGLFQNCFIIDSSGNLFKIKSTIKNSLTSKGIFYALKYSLKNLDSLGTGKKVYITFDVSSPKKKNLDEIKKELKDLFLKNPKWFKNSDFSQAQAIELFINEARTVKELIENISVWS